MDSPGVFEYVPFEPLISYRWNGLFFKFQKPYDNEFWQSRKLLRETEFNYLYTNVIESIEYDRKVATMARAIATSSSIERSKSLMKQLDVSLDVTTRYKVYSRIWDSTMRHRSSMSQQNAEPSPLLKAVEQAMLDCEQLLPEGEPNLEWGPDGETESGNDELTDVDSDGMDDVDRSKETTRVDTFRFSIDREQVMAAMESREAVRAAVAGLALAGTPPAASNTIAPERLLFDADVVDQLVRSSEIVESDDCIVIRRYMDEDELATFSQSVRLDGDVKITGESSIVRMAMASASGARRLGGSFRRPVDSPLQAVVMRGRDQLNLVASIPQAERTAESSSSIESSSGTSPIDGRTPSRPSSPSDAIYYRFCTQFDTLVSMLLHPVNSYKLMCYILSRSVLVERADQEAYGGGLTAHVMGFVAIVLPVFCSIAAFEHVCVKPLIRVLLARPRLAHWLQTGAVLAWVLREAFGLVCNPLFRMARDGFSLFSATQRRRNNAR